MTGGGRSRRSPNPISASASIHRWINVVAVRRAALRNLSSYAVRAHGVVLGCTHLSAVRRVGTGQFGDHPRPALAGVDCACRNDLADLPQSIHRRVLGTELTIFHVAKARRGGACAIFSPQLLKSRTTSETRRVPLRSTGAVPGFMRRQAGEKQMVRVRRNEGGTLYRNIFAYRKHSKFYGFGSKCDSTGGSCSSNQSRRAR